MEVVLEVVEALVKTLEILVVQVVALRMVDLLDMVIIHQLQLQFLLQFLSHHLIQLRKGIMVGFMHQVQILQVAEEVPMELVLMVHRVMGDLVFKLQLQDQHQQQLVLGH